MKHKTVLRFLLALFLSNVVTGCRSEKPVELTVFAASSLTDTLPEIAAGFQQQNPDVTVMFNFAGSSTLATQLSEGARADIFLSANPQQMERVVANALTDGDSFVFAHNRLVVTVPSDNPAGIDSLDDLGRPDVRIVTAVAGVPIRTYTDTLLSNLTDYPTEQFYANVVSEETNVRQMVGKVELGEVDAAIVYQTDVANRGAGVLLLDIVPDNVNVQASYLAVALKDSNPILTESFLEYLQGEEAAAILISWGFMPVDR